MVNKKFLVRYHFRLIRKSVKNSSWAIYQGVWESLLKMKLIWVLLKSWIWKSSPFDFYIDIYLKSILSNHLRQVDVFVSAFFILNWFSSLLSVEPWDLFRSNASPLKLLFINCYTASSTLGCFSKSGASSSTSSKVEYHHCITEKISCWLPR